MTAAHDAADQRSSESRFKAKTVEFRGTIVLNAPVSDVFPLFSPAGEEKWVEGWKPEILFPSGIDWAEGMVFRTSSSGQEEIWVVAELDNEAHRVVYYRTEPGRLVARIEVRCRPLEAKRTETTTVYTYVGLSVAGNAYIAEWTDAAYLSKMQRWQHTINEYLQAITTGRGKQAP
jgi:hypothetical protein